MKLSRSLAVATAAACAVVLAFAPAAHAATLLVSGASSVATVVGDCKADYQSKTGDSFAYASSSSGGGKGDMETGKVDFAFSDSAYTAPQSGGTIPASLIHIPAYVWPIGVMYNLNTTKPVALSPVTVAKIFSGSIKYWDDALIKADNNKTYKVTNYRVDKTGNIVKDKAGNAIVLSTRTVVQAVTLPHQQITVIYRGDDSGTSGNFSAALKAWDPTSFPTNNNTIANTTVMKAAIAADPIHFQSVQKSSGVAALAGKTKYSITYAEVSYAKANNLKIANIINKKGDLVTPSADSAGGFAASLKFTDTGIATYNYLNEAAGVYPFTVVTYALALTKYGDTAKAAAVKRAIDYAAYGCSVAAPDDGFIQITRDSAIGKIIATQLAKLGA